MASNSVVPQQIVVDPMFPVPEGVANITYSDPATNNRRLEGFYDEYSETPESAEEEGAGGTGVEPEYSGVPIDSPEIMSIVSQTLRRAPDGRTVVDVALEVEDVPGSVEYEFRVAKA